MAENVACLQSFIVFFFTNWIWRDPTHVLCNLNSLFFHWEGFFFIYLKNKYYYRLSWQIIAHYYFRGGIYAKISSLEKDDGWVRARAFGVKQQKNNSVLNVKKPLAPKELIFVCRFRLFNVDLLTLNINPSKDLSFPPSIFLTLVLPTSPLFIFAAF